MLQHSQQVIVATGVTQKASDVQELVQVIDQVEANTGQQPEKVLADAGYRSEANFAELEQRGIKGFIPLGREGKDARGSSTDAATCRMARRMRGARGRSTYKMRKRIVEPVFGWIKHVVGFRSFSLRGLRKVRGEWSLVCLALNLKRLNAIMAWE
jgi:IS5 family transposase